jgi:chitinase
VKFGNIDNNYDCADSGEPRPGGGNKPCRQLYKRLHAYPMKGDKVDVTNPKDVIQSAMSNLTNVRSAGLAALFDISLGTFNGEGEDPVTALSMPVFMIQDAIDSMKKIKDIGEKVAEEKKKDLILLILSIVLMVLPFVGEAGGALFGGAAMVGRVALIISEAGNAALGIEQIVGDPLSAPFVLIGMLAGIGGAGGRPAYEAAADARRMMKPEMIAKFPTSFIGKDSLIQKITALCVKK